MKRPLDRKVRLWDLTAAWPEPASCPCSLTEACLLSAAAAGGGA